MKLKLGSIVFIILIALTSILTFSALFDQKTVSDKENRSLQAFPSLDGESYLSGSFFKDLESYFYDHFPAREDLLQLAKLYDKVRGIEPEVMAINGGENRSLVNTDEKKKEKAGTIKKDKVKWEGKDREKEDVEQTGKSSENRKEKEREEVKDFSQFKTQTQNVSVMATKDRIMELFHFDEEVIGSYAAVLGDFAKKMPASVKLYSLLVPTQVGLTDSEYKDYSDPQDKGIEYIYSILDKRYEGVKVFPPLYEKREEYLYFRTDHHWTQLGGYYAAEEFAKRAGVDFLPLSSYTKTSLGDFLGSLYNNNPLEKLAENPDIIEVYHQEEIPVITSKNYDAESGLLVEEESLLLHLDIGSYKTFLGGDSALIEYQNPSPINKRNLMIVKDSYANAFIPWLAPSFNKIIIIDPRYFREDIYALAEAEEITDFLVLDYVLATTMEAYIEQMGIVSGLIE